MIGIKYKKANILQRLLISLKVIKDKRYEGKKVNIYLLDTTHTKS